MVTTSILLVINKVCGYLDNIRYVDIISVADTCPREITLQKIGPLFNIKEGPLPPQSNFFLTDLSDKEFFLIYQLVALVVC